MDKVIAYFRSFDVNGDGTITKEELRPIFDNMSDEEFEKMFQTIDKDGSGTIDYEEFAEWVMAPANPTGQGVIWFGRHCGVAASVLHDHGYTKQEILESQQYDAWSGVSVLELRALKAFYKATRTWNDSTGWSTAWSKDLIPVSKWKGVKVQDGHVVELNLYANGLKGQFPEDFYNLPALRLLQLGANQMRGEISGSVKKLISLRMWGLNNNRLSGSIPAAFGSIQPLDELLLKDNKLTGTIPTSVINKVGLNLETAGNDLRASEDVALHEPQWDWYLMSRENILALPRIPSHEDCKARGILHRMSCLYKAYERWSFENVDADGKTTHVEADRDEIALFSHRWDSPDLDSSKAHPDLPDNSKLEHIKEILRKHREIKLCFFDYWSMQQAPSAWESPNFDAIQGINTMPYYVHNSGNFIILARDRPNLDDYMQSAWCQLEMLCCKCPFEEFTPREYDGKKWTGNQPTGVYNAVPTNRVVSVWNNGNRAEPKKCNFDELLTKQGGVPDPSLGRLTNERDRPQIGVVSLVLLRAMKAVYEKGAAPELETNMPNVCKIITQLEAESKMAGEATQLQAESTTAGEAIQLEAETTQAGKAVEGQ